MIFYRDFFFDFHQFLLFFIDNFKTLESVTTLLSYLKANTRAESNKIDFNLKPKASGLRTGVDYGMQRMGMKGSDYANNLPVLPPYVPPLGTTDKCAIFYRVKLN